MSKPKLALAALVLLALATAPWWLSAGLLNAAIQMLIAALFACAFNLLCGRAGMLSFGHAAYFGVGAFATVHAMNALGGQGLLPTPLLPLAGGAMGLAVGLVAGWFSTQRSGTYFAMITLAIAELIHALAPHLKGLFGGEAGVSSMRAAAWGLSFGPTSQVYWLTLVWVLLCLALLYAFTQTPLGRLALGLRENSHRLAFLGYDVHRVGVLMFAISAMFSGVAGGLQVISNESANYVLLDSHLSAAVVLNTFIGGVHAFLGPAVGAALMTFFGYAVSDLTQSWLLYQGILFVLVMMYMPDGLVGLWSRWPSWKERWGLGRLLGVSVAVLLLAGLAALSTVVLVELLQRWFSQDHQAMVQAAGGVSPAIVLLGREWWPQHLGTWLLPALGLALAGGGGWALRQRLQALNESSEPTA